MTPRIVTVFGGTGFLGRRIVSRLRAHEFSVRIASRHPDHGRELFGADDPRLHSLGADVRDNGSVAEALAGAHCAVNAVSLYIERGLDTFHSLHVEGARRVAALAGQAGVERLVQVSGIGADAASGARYIRSRGCGELAVRAAYPDAIIIRPAVMFAPDDAFLTVIAKMLRQLPVYPMFGRGRTRLQPAFVDDVAAAIVRALQRAEPRPATFELAGPRVYTYEELLRAVAAAAGLRPALIAVPFPAWQVLARLAEMLPNPPLTRNQVDLMRIDTVAAPNMPGFVDLGITPRSIEDILPTIVQSS